MKKTWYSFIAAVMRLWGTAIVLVLLAVAATAGYFLTSAPVDPAEKKADQAVKPFDGDTVNLPGDVKLEMVKIPAGTFVMGSPENESGRSDDEKQHRVTLTKDYWLGKFEVTQAQYEAVMGSNPSYFKGNNRPVEDVSWNDARAFCQKLNERYAGKLPAGYRFDLPTEAQWEYACRAGTNTPFSYGNASDTDKMHFDGNRPYGGGAKGVYRSQTVDVGSLGYKNAFGLYDMHGNVWEWCNDWYGSYNGDATDPVGPSSGSHRVYRGGSWHFNALSCRSAYRYYWEPDWRDINIGFRLALAPVQ